MHWGSWRNLVSWMGLKTFSDKNKLRRPPKPLREEKAYFQGISKSWKMFFSPIFLSKLTAMSVKLLLGIKNTWQIFSLVWHVSRMANSLPNFTSLYSFLSCSDNVVFLQHQKKSAWASIKYFEEYQQNCFCSILDTKAMYNRENMTILFAFPSHFLQDHLIWIYCKLKQKQSSFYVSPIYGCQFESSPLSV